MCLHENWTVNFQACANLGLPHLLLSLHDDHHAHHSFSDLFGDLFHFEEDCASDQTGSALHLTCDLSDYSVDYQHCCHKDGGHQPSDLPMTQVAMNLNHLLGHPDSKSEV
jgi:hypothetical protein